jgi:hypothetical protein
VSNQGCPRWVLALQVILLLVLIGFRFAEPVGDADLFWQMSYGEYMLKNHTLIPNHELYSWTPAKTDVLYCSWIAEIFYYLLHQVGGLPLLFAFRYIGVFSVVVLAWLFARQVGWHNRAEFWLMSTWLVLCSYVGSILKPELFSLIFFSAYAYSLYRFRLEAREGGPALRYLVATVVLMGLWVNSHGVFFFGLIALMAYTLGEVMNWYLSPGQAADGSSGLGIPRLWRKRFLATVLANLGVVFLNPYHYHLITQHVGEVIGVVGDSHDAGRKAAYQSLAAHQPMWTATAFHFHQYFAMGIVLAVLVVTWLGLHGREKARVDYSFFTVNVALGAAYTLWLRTTFYWGPFLVYSLMTLLHELRERPIPLAAPVEAAAEDGEEGEAGPLGTPAAAPILERRPESSQGNLLDALFTGANFLFLFLYYSYSDVLAGQLRMAPVKASAMVILGGIALQVLVVCAYTLVRLSEKDSRPGYLQARSWLTGFCLLAQIFLTWRTCRESVYEPYAASWCGFGISYWNPVDEVAFIEKYHPDLKTIINDYDSGGYILWKLYPKTKVMIDPRSFPYMSFWADYIAYERGQIGLEFLDRFPGKKSNVSLVSLKNQNLWRTYLRSPDWVPGWLGTAYVVFVRKGHEYPPDASNFLVGRFETIHNPQKALHIFQFGIESRLYNYSWQILDVMKRKFNSTPEQKRLNENLEAYKGYIQALEKKDLDKAISEQERCAAIGMFFNGAALLDLYKIKLAKLKDAGKKESDPEFQATYQKAQQVVQFLNGAQR